MRWPNGTLRSITPTAARAGDAQMGVTDATLGHE
jgi:hypothetical protein